MLSPADTSACLDFSTLGFASSLLSVGDAGRHQAGPPRVRPVTRPSAEASHHFFLLSLESTFQCRLPPPALVLELMASTNPFFRRMTGFQPHRGTGGTRRLWHGAHLGQSILATSLAQASRCLHRAQVRLGTSGGPSRSKYCCW